MKRLYLSLLLLSAAVCFFNACTKKEISSSFGAQSSVYFIFTTGPINIGNIDSLSYSFVEKNSTITKDTVWLPVRVAGNVADHDRAINLAAVASGTTAVQGVHYKLLSYSMPKDSFATRLGVVLLRDASLRDTSLALKLEIKPSSDFPVLMQDTLMGDGRFYSRNQFKILFTDRLIKPSNWDSYLVSFFGAYSNTKFRYIAEVLGVSSFPTTGSNAVNYPTMQYYQNVMRNALVDYTAAHGPMIDENGNPVVFP